MLISRIVITLTPWMHVYQNGSEATELEIQVIANGEKRSFKQVIQNDHFNSLYDRCFEHAKDEIREHFKKAEEKDDKSAR